MTADLMMTIQILADTVLLFFMLFLIWALRKERKRMPVGVDAMALSEFEKLVKESRDSSDHLLEALREVRKIAAALDEKEKRLMALAVDEDRKPDAGRDEKYASVVRMAGQGLDESTIADTLNLAEGEISLILGLHRNKNENSHRPTDSR
jgi:CHAT domain-containing protein